jgi:hypothetical protein
MIELGVSLFKVIRSMIELGQTIIEFEIGDSLLWWKNQPLKI